MRYLCLCLLYAPAWGHAPVAQALFFFCCLKPADTTCLSMCVCVCVCVCACMAYALMHVHTYILRLHVSFFSYCNMDCNVSITSFARSKTDSKYVCSARRPWSHLRSPSNYLFRRLAPHQNPRLNIICRYNFSRFLSIYMSTSFSS